MNILKLFLPSGELKQMDEVESFTLTWETKSGWGGNYNYHHKVFTSKLDAKEYEDQLNNANKFLQTGFRISPSITKN